MTRWRGREVWQRQGSSVRKGGGAQADIGFKRGVNTGRSSYGWRVASTKGRGGSRGST